MLFSYIVLPADATGSTDGDSAEETVSNAVPELKFTLSAETLNYYEKNKPVLVYGNWLQYLADNGYTSLSNMLKNEAEQYINLMPAEGATQWDTNVLATNAIPTFHDDGTVTITNNAVYTGNHYWPYVSTTPSMTIDLDATPYLYFSYSGNAEFNLAFYYNGITDTNVSVGSNYLGSDFPEGTHTYCIDLKACTGLSGKISLDKCLFYVIGGTNDYVTLSNIGLSSINLTQDSDIRKGVYLDGYTALMIEFMGNVKSGQSGAEGAEYFVDAVLDCGVAFDEAPHQLLSKTQYGFVLYIPDAVMDTLDKKPARGDLIDATFSYNELSELTQSGTCELWRTLYFYENPSEAIKYATATDVNATVNLFNYGENISQNGFNFWNGYWGWGPAIESVDGAGTENGVYRNPVPMDTLTADGYPQLSDGNGGSYGLDYLFNGSTGLVDTMTNGGGLFQMDEDGYYYYDSMQNAAYYDSEKESFVLYEDLIVRPWYHSNGGFDYKADSNYKDYANVGGDATVYGNFLPFNKVTEENITVDGAVYYNQITDGILNADGNTYYTEIHAVDESYTAFRNAAGSLEKYGLNNTAADKVLAGTKAMFKDAYDEIVQVNGGDVMTARLEDKLDLGFGMTVDFDFYMPQGGKVNGEAMEFDFLGDDDVFVYVGIWTGEEYEYKLVLDIGGIHEAKNGNIDFSTGAVADWPCSNTAARTGRTLRSIFGDAYAEYFDGDTFADFTKLSLKFFYLERGGNISYCRLRFNIPTLPENSLTIGKALDHEVLGSQTYQFRVLKAVWNETTQKYEATDELFIPEGTEYTIAGSSKTGTVGAGGYFPLSPGQSVTFHNVLASSHGTHYVVEETITQEVDSQFTIESPVCAVNGVSAEVTEVENAPEGQYVYRTEALVLDTTESQSQARSVKTQIVGFTNMVDMSQLGTLKISKEIERGANIPEDAEFDMRVTLGGALLPVGTTYDVVDTATGAIISDDVKVTTKGIVTLKADQTVVIEGILSTSTIEVVEDSSIYSASYYSQSSTIQCSNKGAAGIMPLGGVIEVVVTNDDSNVITDKTVAEGAADDEFVLTLEAFATGITNTVSLTAPADIVLVLDQSASMYTPKGATSDSYAKSSASGSITDSIADAFGEIMTSVSSASVTLDQTAILKEYLSGYFDLNDVDPEDIQVFVAKVNGQVDGKYTFDEAVSVAPLTDDNRAFAETNGFANIGVKFSANEAGRSDTVVEVNGFDYAGNYVHQDTTTGEWIGYKIIVEVPIKDRAGFWGGNNVPTNENITAIYDDKGNEVQDFPMPEVNIPVTPVISTKNQVVYYADGTIKAEHVFDKVTVDGYLVVYDEAEGTFVPGDLTSDADDWMDDYASLNWSSGSCTLDTPISSVEEGDYTFGVTLAPLKDHTGKDNMSANGSNIAGDPVSMSGSSASSTGHVDVLVPVLNFQDSTITLGDKTDKDYYDATNDVTDYDNMTWVDMNDPNDESGALKGAFATMGTEPELTLSYSPEGTGENYFQVDTPVDVTVKIGELNITEKSYFMWENCESGLHDETAITTHKGDVDSYEFYIHVAYVLGNDVVVIDFGLPVDISVMGNDKLPDGATVKGVMIGSLPSGMTDSLSAEFVQSLTSNSIHGKVTVMANSAVRYEPADMNMSAAETFIYAVEAVNGRTAYYYATVTVVPATNIYYEDSFLSFENSTAADADDAAATLGKWTQSDDTASDATQAEDRPGVDLGDALKELDADNVYGYDAAYDEMTTYSLNNAWHVTVDAATGNATTAPKATFRFTGTGFDVISVTDSTSGAIWVKVTDKDSKVVRSSIVNNYYGFAYDSESGEWNPAEENDGSVLYQVPAIKISGLDYATYDVEIKAVYLSSMDVEKTGSYTIWLDAIRIYNPAMNDSISNDVYEQDGEANPWYTTVKSLLTGTDTFVNGSADGIMFIDGKGTSNVTMIDYANQGPNNETYLLGGNGIAFKLLSNSVNEPDVSLQIGAKLAYGTSATLKYNDSELKTLTTASNMFYKLGELTWTQVTIDGITCWASNSIVLSCVAAEGNILALTDIKVTGDDAASISASNSDNPFENSGLAAVTDDQVMDDATTGAVTLRAKYGSLSMVGQVMLNVYFEGTGLESISTDDMGLLLWSEQPADATYANAEKILPGATYSSQYNQYWSQTNGIPAKNMGDDIYFRVYAKLTDGTYVYSQMIKYSPKIYAMDRLANSNSDAMKKLCVALLNYGAAAQLQAGYKTDALMNADLTAEQLASIENYSSSMVTGGNAVTEAKAGSFGIVNTGFSSRYPSVSFEGAFSINYYFTPSHPVRGDVTLYAWSAEDYANVDVLTTANATTAVRMTLLEDGRYWADYTDISARKVNEKVYVCAVYKTDGAVAHTSGVVAYSVADYCVDRVTNSTNPNMQALAMATVVYSHYAKQYFG